MAQQTLNRKQILKDYPSTYPLALGLLILAIGFLLGATWFKGDDNGLSYATNLYTELISIGITVIILDRINQWRDDRRLKHNLLEDLKSSSVAPAVNALERLRREGWLDGNSLIDKDLKRANWEGAYIGGLNFENADMRDINLKNTTAFDGQQHQPIIFKKAYLWGANLQKARLCEANLQQAKLWGANLQQADLEGANLQQADLGGANLTDINWDANQAEYSFILPDGTEWTPDEDMGRFTDKNHPEYEETLEIINGIRYLFSTDPIE